MATIAELIDNIMLGFGDMLSRMHESTASRETNAMEFTELSTNIVTILRNRLPKPVRDIVDAYNLVVAGGWCRDIYAGDEPHDVDVFCGPIWTAQEAAQSLDPKATLSNNAYNVGNVQFIFDRGTGLQDVLERFDFTVNMVGLQGTTGLCHKRWAEDLANKTIYVPDPLSVGLEHCVVRMAKLQGRGYTVANPLTELPRGIILGRSGY